MVVPSLGRLPGGVAVMRLPGVWLGAVAEEDGVGGGLHRIKHVRVAVIDVTMGGGCGRPHLLVPPVGSIV